MLQDGLLTKTLLADLGMGGGGGGVAGGATGQASTKLRKGGCPAFDAVWQHDLMHAVGA